MMLGLLALISTLQASPAVVLPGVLDLPLLEGTAVSADCMGYRARLAAAGKPFECLVTTFGAANDFAFAYINAAKDKGWIGDGAAANAVYMRRTLPDGVCQKLAVAGLPGTQAMAAADPAYILIAVEPVAPCPRPSSNP